MRSIALLSTVVNNCTLTPAPLNTVLFVIVKFLVPVPLKDVLLEVRLIISPSAQPLLLLLSRTTAI